MMHPDGAKDYVEVLLDYQFDLLWKRGFGNNHAEFLFAQASAIICRYPELREWLVSQIRSNVFGSYRIDGNTLLRPAGYIPHEFIFYFAHVTRWPELGNIANEVRGSSSDELLDNPFNKWSTKLAEALTDDWEDRDFYSFGSAANVV